MKKHLRLILTVCLALCMVLCLGLATACEPTGQGNTFTVTILNADGTPAANQKFQYCSEEGSSDKAGCHPTKVGSNGKFSFNLDTEEWKASSYVHIQFVEAWLDGYVVYDADGVILDYDDGSECYEDYVDHNDVNSVTYTLKKVEDILTGYQYSVFNIDRIKTYSTLVKANEAYLDVDVNGGQFDLSVKINGVDVPGLSTTLSATNNTVHLEDLGGSNFNGVPVEFTVSPKNASSDHLTLTVCPVYEVGAEDVPVLASHDEAYLDVYKVYFSLGVNAELVFSDYLDDNFSAIGGYPIDVTVGDYEITWDDASDILPITALNEGLVPVTFAFDDPTTANLSLLVKDANAASSEKTIELDDLVPITLSNNWDESQVYKFTVTTDGAYYVLVEDGADAIVSFIVYAANDYIGYGDAYYASNNDGVLAVALVYNELVFDDPESWIPSDTIPHLTLSAGDVVEITFRTAKESSDSYNAKVTTDIGSLSPSIPGEGDTDSNGGGTGDSGNTITLGSEFELTLVFMEPQTLTFSSYGMGTYTIVVEIDDIEELDYISYNSTNLSYTESEGKYVFEFEVTEDLFETVSLTFYSSFGTTCKVTVDQK